MLQELLPQLAQGDAVPCCHGAGFIQGVSAVIQKAVKSQICYACVYSNLWLEEG